MIAAAPLVVRPAPADPANYWPDRAGHRPLAVVHHVMLGTAAGTRAAFATPGFGASAHYGIAPDGTIEQYVPDEAAAWSNGPVRLPNLAAVPWLGTLGGANPNRLTLSVEWAGAHSGGRWIRVPWAGGTLPTLAAGSVARFWTPTPAQYAAGVALTRRLCARWAIPADRAHICRHSDFDRVSKWFCPGLWFPLAQLLADLAPG